MAPLPFTDVELRALVLCTIPLEYCLKALGTLEHKICRIPPSADILDWSQLYSVALEIQKGLPSLWASIDEYSKSANL